MNVHLGPRDHDDNDKSEKDDGQQPVMSGTTRDPGTVHQDWVDLIQSLMTSPSQNTKDRKLCC